MLRHMHLVPAHQLKSFQKSFYIIRIFRPLSGILEKSVMLRLCVGLKIFTDNEINDRAEDKFQPGHFKESVSVSFKNSYGILKISDPGIFRVRIIIDKCCRPLRFRITGWQWSAAELPARVDAVVIALYPSKYYAYSSDRIACEKHRQMEI
jgi:hypothetical protein